MKKKFVVYANCQGRALAKTLLECKEFSDSYEWIPLKPVHTVLNSEISEVLNSIFSADLVIAQPISSQGRDDRLSWDYIQSHLDHRTTSITFPSLYFNGYFPHIGTLKGLSSPFGMTHDFAAGFAFCEGLELRDALSKITDPTFYSEDLSKTVIPQLIPEFK